MKAEYICHMGSDDFICDAARVSFDKQASQYTEGQNAKLIKYLATHDHWSPFAHPQITLRETVPIFVARQRFKHVVGFCYNEVSRRYVDDEPEFYTPDVWRSRPEGSVKQGSGDDMTKHQSEYWRDSYRKMCNTCAFMYKDMVERGVAPEQARMVLPQSMYTSYYVTGSLAAWARAYKQRIESGAQVEIQKLAKQWGEVIAPLFPESWAVLTAN
jgi:thymidylate synthase (FAD)